MRSSASEIVGLWFRQLFLSLLFVDFLKPDHSICLEFFTQPHLDYKRNQQKKKQTKKKKVQCNVGVEMHVCFDFLITYSSLPNNRSSWNNRPGWNFYKLILSNSDEN